MYLSPIHVPSQRGDANSAQTPYSPGKVGLLHVEVIHTTPTVTQSSYLVKSDQNTQEVRHERFIFIFLFFNTTPENCTNPVATIIAFVKETNKQLFYISNNNKIDNKQQH